VKPWQGEKPEQHQTETAPHVPIVRSPVAAENRRGNSSFPGMERRGKERHPHCHEKTFKMRSFHL
jgi:hypothetical protein